MHYKQKLEFREYIDKLQERQFDLQQGIRYHVGDDMVQYYQHIVGIHNHRKELLRALNNFK
jgi:hypothetical protein